MVMGTFLCDLCTCQWAEAIDEFLTPFPRPLLSLLELPSPSPPLQNGLIPFFFFLHGSLASQCQALVFSTREWKEDVFTLGFIYAQLGWPFLVELYIMSNHFALQLKKNTVPNHFLYRRSKCTKALLQEFLKDPRDMAREQVQKGKNQMVLSTAVFVLRTKRENDPVKSRRFSCKVVKLKSLTKLRELSAFLEQFEMRLSCEYISQGRGKCVKNKVQAVMIGALRICRVLVIVKAERMFKTIFAINQTRSERFRNCWQNKQQCQLASCQRRLAGAIPEKRWLHQRGGRWYIFQVNAVLTHQCRG